MSWVVTLLPTSNVASSSITSQHLTIIPVQIHSFEHVTCKSETCFIIQFAYSLFTLHAKEVDFQILSANRLTCQVWHTHLQRQLSQALPAAPHHYSINNNNYFCPPVNGFKMFWISSNTEQNFIMELYLATVPTPWTLQSANCTTYFFDIQRIMHHDTFL